MIKHYEHFQPKKTPLSTEMTWSAVLYEHCVGLLSKLNRLVNILSNKYCLTETGW